MRVQTAAAVPASGEALQQGASFPHGATHLVRPRSCVPRDACLIGLISLPVDEAFMMLRDEDLPFGTRQVSYALAANPCRVQCRLPPGFAIGVGAGIDGVRQHVVDSGVARLDPTDPAALVHLPREAEPFAA